MACIIWIDNDAAHDSVAPIYAGGWSQKAGQKITVPNKTICKVVFKLCKGIGSPTGNGYARIRKASDHSIIETSGDVLDVSILPLYPSWSWIEFTFDSLINEEVDMLFEYDGGDINNQLGLSATLDSILGMFAYYNGSWHELPAKDAAIRIYEEEVVGEEHFETVTEILGLADSFTAIKHRFQTVTDILGLSDSFTQVATYHVTPTDILGLIDSYTAPKHMFQTVTETLGLTDTFTVTATYYTTQTEILSLVDTVTTKKTIHVTVTDILGMVDTVPVAPAKIQFKPGAVMTFTFRSVPDEEDEG